MTTIDPHQPKSVLTLDVQTGPQATIVRVTGSAGMREAEHMRSVLEELNASCPAIIVLDLSRMDFICSMGLGAIIQGHLRSRHHSGQIRLVNPQPAVRELLETTRLTKLFPVFASVEEAVGSPTSA